jgi:hypothetical protein
MALKMRKTEPKKIVAPKLKITDFNNPKFDPGYAQIAQAAEALRVACEEVLAQPFQKTPHSDTPFDNAADQAELLVLALMRLYHNETMMSYVADELARAIKRGW